MSEGLVGADAVFIWVRGFEYFLHPFRCQSGDFDVGSFAQQVLAVSYAARHFVDHLAAAPSPVADGYRVAGGIPQRLQHPNQFGVDNVETAMIRTSKFTPAEILA